MPKICDRPNFTLKILPLSEFTPILKKQLGTRPGAIGNFKSDNSQFMVKYEGYGYVTTVIGKATENDVVESITAQLIRAIWGQHLATDIHIAKADTPLPHTYPFLITPKQEMVSVKIPYMVASRWLTNARALNELNTEKYKLDPQFAAQLTELQTIAKLLGISDYKFGNIIMNGDTNKPMLVDCAANYRYVTDDAMIDNLLQSSLYAVNLGENFQKTTAIKTIKTFIQFKDADAILNQYSDIISSKTLTKILDRLKFTQLLCENYLIKVGELPNTIENSTLFKPANQPPSVGISSLAISTVLDNKHSQARV